MLTLLFGSAWYPVSKPLQICEMIIYVIFLSSFSILHPVDDPRTARLSYRQKYKCFWIKIQKFHYFHILTRDQCRIWKPFKSQTFFLTERTLNISFVMVRPPSLPPLVTINLTHKNIKKNMFFLVYFSAHSAYIFVYPYWNEDERKKHGYKTFYTRKEKFFSSCLPVRVFMFVFNLYLCWVMFCLCLWMQVLWWICIK